MTCKGSQVRVLLSPRIKRYTNILFEGSVEVYRNVFALIVEIDDYEGETYLYTNVPHIKEIRVMVKKNYGLHVSSLVILWTKNLCGPASLSVRTPWALMGHMSWS